MRDAVRNWSATALVILFVLFCGWLIGSSKSFQQCVRETKQQEGGNALQKGVSDLPIVFRRYKGCTGFFIIENKDAIGAVSTLIIAIFTATLWLATSRLWRTSEDSAKAALISANVADRMARHVERPYVFLGDLKADYVEANALARVLAGTPRSIVPADKDAIEFKYTLQNHGRMPAVVYEIKHDIGFIVFERGKAPGIVELPPPAPLYSAEGRRRINEVISGTGGKTKEYAWTFRPKTESGPFGNIPVIYGWIRYRDASGRRYRAGFGFTWSGAEFSPYDGEAYNYDQELKLGDEEPTLPIRVG